MSAAAGEEPRRPVGSTPASSSAEIAPAALRRGDLSALGWALASVCACLLAGGCGGASKPAATAGRAASKPAATASRAASAEAQRIEAPCVAAQSRLRPIVHALLPAARREGPAGAGSFKRALEHARAAAQAIELRTLAMLRAEHVEAHYRPGLEELIARIEAELGRLRAVRAALRGERTLSQPMQRLFQLGEAAEGCRVYRSAIAG